MLRLVDLARLGRPVRQDDWPDLGVATPEKTAEAIPEHCYRRVGRQKPAAG